MPDTRKSNSKKRSKASESRTKSGQRQVRSTINSSQTPATMHVKRSAPSRKETTSKPKRDHLKSSTKTTKSANKSQAKAKISSKPQAKAKLRAPRTEAQYTAKPEKFKETWDHVLAAISKMRREKISLTQASRDIGISPRTVTKWGKSALRKRPNGKYAVKASDSLLRIVLIPTPEGTREIAVRGSKQVTMLAEYWNALHRYLQTGNTEKLKQFEGKSIADANGVDVPLLTDLAALNRLGSAGVLSFESLYARTA